MAANVSGRGGSDPVRNPVWVKFQNRSNQNELRLRTISKRIASLLVEGGLSMAEDALQRVASALVRSGGLCMVSELAGKRNGIALAVFDGFHIFLSHFVVARGRQGLDN